MLVRTHIRQSLLLLALGVANFASAQTALTFSPVSVASNCDDTQTISTTEELTWNTYDGCADVALGADGSTLTITASSDSVSSVIGYATNWELKELTVPGEPGTYSTLKMWLVGPDAGKFDEIVSNFYLSDVTYSNPDYAGSFSQDGGSCGGTLQGGTTYSLSAVHLVFAALPSEAVEVKIMYAWEESGAQSVLASLEVPETDFNGSSYVSALPTGNVAIIPNNGDLYFRVGLADNKPASQDILLTKSEGGIWAPNYVVLIPQAALEGDPHRVSLSLNNVEICLPPNGEFLLGDGASLRLSNTTVKYNSNRACLGVFGDGEIIVAAGTDQKLGDRGTGMQLFGTGGTLTLEDGASTLIDAVFNVSGQARIELGANARLVVGANSTLDEGYRQSIKVYRHPTATINLSLAPREVRELFEVITVSSTPELIATEKFRAFPNPASADGRVTLTTTGVLEADILRIDLIDALGRQVQSFAPSEAGNATGFKQDIHLPSSGLFTARLTDRDGRVGYLKLMGQ